MADEPTDDEIRERLRNLSRYMGIPKLAAAIPSVGERTLYNQLAEEPPPMRPRTRTALIEFLEGLGLLEDGADVRAVARELLEATSTASDAVRAARLAVGKRGSQGGGKKAGP